MKNIEPLVRAIIAAIVLLENSPDSEIDPDTAVHGLEGMAAALHEMDDADRAEFVQCVAIVAAAESEPAMRAFIQNVPHMLGLVDEPPLR